MTPITNPQFHTAEEEWLAAYAAGSLSRAKRLLLTCQAAINPGLSQKLVDMDRVGGALLETAPGDAMSETFISKLLSKLDTAQTQAPETPPAKTPSQNWIPDPLTDFLSRADTPFKWKKMGFGMARIPILTEQGEKLYLLKSPPGRKMPVHSHHGEEWALILQGGYHVGKTGYVRGDLHREDETCTHRPVIDDHGEACITLVAAERGIKFKNPLLRLLSPIFGL